MMLPESIRRGTLYIIFSSWTLLNQKTNSSFIYLGRVFVGRSVILTRLRSSLVVRINFDVDEEVGGEVRMVMVGEGIAHWEVTL